MIRPPMIRSNSSHSLDRTDTFHKLRNHGLVSGSMSHARKLLMHSHYKLETDSNCGNLGMRQVIGHISMWEATSKWIRLTCQQEWEASDRYLPLCRYSAFYAVPDEPRPSNMNSSSVAPESSVVEVLSPSNASISCSEQERMATISYSEQERMVTVTTMELL